MKINLIKVAEEVFKDKELIIKEIDKHKVEIKYKNIGKRTSNHFYPRIILREIKLDV